MSSAKSTAAPQSRPVELPSGGGSLRGMNESFAANQFSGSCEVAIPIRVSPARGLEPKLAVAYSSLQGMDVFGLGFALELPAIKRRTSQSFPKYTDADVFMFEGVALVKTSSSSVAVEGVTFSVDRFVQAVESQFDRIERWTDPATGDAFWRVTARDAGVTVFGRSPDARIADPENQARVLAWLPQCTYDSRGNVLAYSYKPEDTTNVPAAIYERNRASTAQRYLERIRYGNDAPIADPESPASLDRATWCFETVFDYGEYDIAATNDAPFVPVRKWAARADAFSDYSAGFELRTHRLCRSILQFHRFSELAPVPVLTAATIFSYDESPAGTLLTAVRSCGYRYRAGAAPGTRYRVGTLPALRFSYTPADPSPTAFVPLLTDTGASLPGFDSPPAFAPVDLFGEGVPGIAYADGSTVAYFEPRLSAASDAVVYGRTFLPAFPIERAVAASGITLTDIDGDGRQDLQVTVGGRAGYYRLRSDREWDGFRPFDEFPTNFDDPANVFVDVTGDGRPDILRIDPESLEFSPSLGYAGFGPFETRPARADWPCMTASPTLEFAFGNVFGTGGRHRVRIASGSITAWPNLGYGNFGAPVEFANAPAFSTSMGVTRTSLVDIDGNGCSDLVVVRNDRVEIFRNLSGNAFEPVPTVVPLPGPCTSPSQVTFADLDGSGFPSLIYTNDDPAPRHWRFRFPAGRRALLCAMDNGAGGTVAFEYKSSAGYYLEDKRAGIPWVTNLPFPVQVVAAVRTRDALSDASTTSVYRYRHGYYDPVEREFRGFAYVEQIDAPAAGPSVADASAGSPSITKTWFHTGAWLVPALEEQLETEYFAGDTHAYPMPQAQFTWLDATPLAETSRQGRSALAGRQVRTELYGVDSSVPYEATQTTYEVRQDARPGPRYASFFAFERESVVYEYECQADDPKVTHHFTLGVDTFGDVERSAVAYYPRRSSAPPAIAAQSILHGACTVSTFAVQQDTPAVYFGGIETQERLFQLSGFPAFDVGDRYFSLAAFDGFVEAALSGSDRQAVATLLTHARRSYQADGLGNPLPQALLVSSDVAMFTDAAVRDIFAGTAIGTSLDANLKDLCGCTFDSASGLWFKPGMTRTYAGAAAFYVALQVSDPFAGQGAQAVRSGTTTTLTYDPHTLMVAGATVTPSRPDIETLSTTVTVFDYQTLNAQTVIDPNGITSQILQDPLGRVIVSSHHGIERVDGLAQHAGFSVLDIDAIWPEPSAVADVVNDPGTYLGGAAAFYFNDVLAWERASVPMSGVSLTATVYPGSPGPPAGDWTIPTAVHYWDATGQPLQTSVKVEPGVAHRVGLPPAPADRRWLVSGRTRYNTKGHPYRTYQPLYVDTYEFLRDEGLATFGAAATQWYDAVDRLVRTDIERGPFVDAFYSKVVYGDAWTTQTWDFADTILDARYYQFYVVDGHELPPLERQALIKAAAYAATPSTIRTDALDHAVEGSVQLEAGIDRTSSAGYDFLGNLLWSADARLGPFGVKNSVTTFAMDGTPVSTSSVDGGPVRTLSDAVGAPVLSCDGRGFTVANEYDSLHRPTLRHVTGGDGATPLDNVVRRIIYGETLDPSGATVYPAADGRNLRGQAVVVYDEAQRRECPVYSLCATALATSVQVRATVQDEADWSTPQPLDWSPLFGALAPRLDTTVYASSQEADALGRTLRESDPATNVRRYAYYVSGRLANTHFTPAGGEERAIATAIAYDPRDARTLITYGAADGSPLATTAATYDDQMQWLDGLRTVRADGVVLQDLAYVYDPIGNTSHIADAASPVGRIIRSNQVVTPDADYAYDALYRLVTAQGRARIGLTAASQRDGGYESFFGAAQGADPNDPGAVENYTLTYGYDTGENLTQTRYVSASARWTTRLQIAPDSNRGVLAEEPLGQFPASSFDAMGNMLAIDGLAGVAWNYRNMLAHAGVIVRAPDPPDGAYFHYDSLGTRVRRSEQRLVDGSLQTVETRYLSNLEIGSVSRGGAVVEQYTRALIGGVAGTLTQHLSWSVGSPPAGVAAPQYRFGLNDALGSSCVEIDGSGALVSYEQYAPFGSTTYAAGPSVREVSLKEYRFTGKDRDRRTGLCYFGARYYAPWLGRWISADPSGDADGLNRYAYVHNNPLSYIDQRGYGPSYLRNTRARKARSYAIPISSGRKFRSARDDKTIKVNVSRLDAPRLFAEAFFAAEAIRLAKLGKASHAKAMNYVYRLRLKRAVIHRKMRDKLIEKDPTSDPTTALVASAMNLKNAKMAQCHVIADSALQQGLKTVFSQYAIDQLHFFADDAVTKWFNALAGPTEGAKAWTSFKTAYTAFRTQGPTQGHGIIGASLQKTLNIISPAYRNLALGHASANWAIDSSIDIPVHANAAQHAGEIIGATKYLNAVGLLPKDVLDSMVTPATWLSDGTPLTSSTLITNQRVLGFLPNAPGH